MELITAIINGIIYKVSNFSLDFDISFTEGFLTFGAIFFFLFWYYGMRNWVREGLDYHPLSNASYPNPINQLKGNKWTQNSVLKNKFSQTKTRSLKLDNFEFATSHEKNNVSFFVKRFMKKAEIYIEPTKLCESFTMMAPMGGGKTVTMDSLLVQDWYHRVLINDEKSGDFVSRHYNKRKDIILCPYDARAHVWNVLGESIEVVEYYIINALKATNGENKNFFTNDAKERYKTIARLTLEIEDAKEKWDYFIKELEEMFQEVESNDQNSAKDVISTMHQIVEGLRLNQYQLSQGKKSFTIEDFFTKKNQSKLFMVTIDKYEVILNPLFSAFTACFSMIHASQKELKLAPENGITFYLLDEYISLKMSYEAKVLLHTKIRSKGGALISAMHYLPDEQKMFDLLTSSTYGYMIFSIKNGNTRKYFNEQIGKRDYKIKKVVDKKLQESIKSEEILDWAENDRLSKDKKHIIYVPEEGALFVAQSDLIEKPIINKPFILDESIHKFNLKMNEVYFEKKKKKGMNVSASKKYEKA